ncbi:DNA/RNA helicase domain-containing protein [Bacteroides caecimuris]|uniref:DNA/RNA helicase domain-containing protein n=1 Tax=Bacteroides caecimuris TaxID=1796613 RepID=UPI0026ED59E4|nr:DNA/RNA helicase domain-containing protein [Bacteroides caecimuris]
MANNKTNRCLYRSDFKSFIESDPYSILGHIHDAFHGQALTSTDEAWNSEINLLQRVLVPWKDEDAEIIFEYDIPRLGKRIDAVLLLRGIIFCLEFKVGQKDALQSDVEQVMDYALDLKNFHRYSHDRIIVPILIPTKHRSSSNSFIPSVYDDSIFNPLITGANGLQNLINGVLQHARANTPGTIKDWIISPYTPTPTIIEAARSLYENHSVEDITRHEADKVTTDATIAYILDIINRSKKNGEKSICFVTGVPGAGKTLVGLDVAVKQSYQEDGTFNVDDGAVYLSGNGPLVAVLTEALARDDYKKSKNKGEDKKLSDSRREVSKFIQIIHRYRDNMLAKIKNPVVDGKLEIDPHKAVKLQQSGYGEVEHVAIFDEAQRAWTHKRIADYLKRGGTYGNKLKVANFPMSEAAFLIWSLDQREDWATIVCLIGGGQEINTGEAGISEWIAAINNRFQHWRVYISDKLTEPEYAEGKVTELLKHNSKVEYSDRLHLGVSLRSFRAERLSAFVHSLLSFNPDAEELYKNVISHRYPIVLTRSMDKARSWLRQQARGTQQTGILISKVSARFKPLAVHVLPQSEDNAVHWFLEDKTDVRSSNYLEEAATEIQVQGLEVDYACVLWDADMRYDDGKWSFWKFNGKTQWIPEKNIETQKYMLNAYRVLLTRARQGMVICVPEGNSNKTPEGFPEDPTRLPAYYNSTYEYLKRLGLDEI